jgi:hypothetical protein
MVFVSLRKKISDNTRVRILFFCRANGEIFSQNLTLGYMTKTLIQIIFFFPPPKSEYFFQQHWESEYFFRKKTITPPRRDLINYDFYYTRVPGFSGIGRTREGTRLRITFALYVKKIFIS